MELSQAELLICPVCGESLSMHERTMGCIHGHRFDVAREGYVNLLRSSKSGDHIGDDKQSARCRRDFLNKGYYSVLKNHLQALFSDRRGSVLDICCGEGYYTAALAENENLQVYGFDISREMVRLAAKRGKIAGFVANLAAIPVAPESFDYAVHLFAPFQEAAFSRILKTGGRLYTVIPGSHHLYGLKEAIYEKPYINDEKLPETENLKLISKTKIAAGIRLACQEDIDAVFRMTPYYFHTGQKDKEKLLGLDALETKIEFVIGEYEK